MLLMESYQESWEILMESYNSFSSHIPSSFGNLNQIESLDLSCNAFSGKIPTQLANLDFLSYLNLYFNKLSGKVPIGSQLKLFDASSYKGNQRLYGPPLTEHNPGANPTTSSQGSDWSSKSEIEGMFKGAGVGFQVGITIFVRPIIYIKRYREWYCNHLHRVVMKTLRKEDNITQRRRRRSGQQVNNTGREAKLRSRINLFIMYEINCFLKISSC